MDYTYLKYTRNVPISIEMKLPTEQFEDTPTYAEVLDWLLLRDMWLEVRFFGINGEVYEFRDMRGELEPHRICRGGDVRALDIVIGEAIDYVNRRDRKKK